MLWVSAVLVLVGLAVLVAGAEGLVRGASRLAASLGVSPLAVGLTVVAFGTSAPELVVSVFAAADGNGAMAVGNVVGSNLFNLLVVVGAAALVFPLSVHAQVVRREVPVLLGVSLVAWGLLATGATLGRVEAVLLVFALAVYTVLAYVAATRETGPSVEALHTAGAIRPERSARYRLLCGAWILGGLALLVVGGRLAILGAVGIAQDAGVPDRIVGLTILAVGTSLPELATSLVAALRRHSDLAVGNVVGSNLFNLLGILGVAALVRPLEVPGAMLRFDLPAMLLVTLVMVPVLWTGYRVSRREAAFLLLLYGGYIVLLVVT